MIFFTSDTHYWHKNIIQFSRRPFGSLEQMHAAFIRNWNEVVTHEDTVYHLGDVSFAGRGHTLMILSQLKGRIVFLPGNHDNARKMALRPGLDTVSADRILDVTYRNQKLVLSHYPLMTWEKAHHGAWMLHGHCHGSLDERNATTTRLDVGVDGVASYYPLSFDNVCAVMHDRRYEIVDQHGRRPHEIGR
jgi:calcineurin-like phosphoesterase family protein